MKEGRARAWLLSRLKRWLEYHHVVYGPPERFTVGSDVALANTLINTICGNVTIGDRSFMGHDVLLLTGSHPFDLTMADRQIPDPAGGRDIVIGRGVWIASKAVILGPCTIGDNAVIAGGCIVDRDIPANVIVRERRELEIEPIRFRGSATE